MSEKWKKYLRLKNDKNLIDGQLPKENDLKIFEKWKKRMHKYSLRTIWLSSSILILGYVSFLITNVFSSLDMKNKIFMIVGFLIFTYVEYILIKKSLNIKKWQMEYCTYGKVIDKYKDPRSSNAWRYFIVVEINENVLKVEENSSEYLLLDVDDEVIAFSIKGHNEVYIAKNE